MTLTTPTRQAAYEFAAKAHAGQYRKGTSIPYVEHCAAVARLVKDYGGTQTQIVAALLHDCAEDCGGAVMLDTIRRQFGREVAGIVAACSDTFEAPKPDWWTRKRAYIAHVAEMPKSALLVSIADKIDNILSTTRDVETDGPLVWRRFKTGRYGQFWYYNTLKDAFLARQDVPWCAVTRLTTVLSNLYTLAQKPASASQSVTVSPFGAST